MKKIITAALLGIACVATARGQGGSRVYGRQLFTSQVLGDAGASNSVPMNVNNFLPLGNYAVETRISGTGTVAHVHVQASRDGTVWYDASTYVVTNQAVQVDTGDAGTNAYQSVTLPPALWYRLSGQATTGTPILDAWFILH